MVEKKRLALIKVCSQINLKCVSGVILHISGKRGSETWNRDCVFRGDMILNNVTIKAKFSEAQFSHKALSSIEVKNVSILHILYIHTSQDWFGRKKQKTFVFQGHLTCKKRHKDLVCCRRKNKKWCEFTKRRQKGNLS